MFVLLRVEDNDEQPIEVQKKGRGSFGFWQILLMGILGVVRKYRGVHIFFICVIAVLLTSFPK
jgi:hypothetical protein